MRKKLQALLLPRASWRGEGFTLLETLITLVIVAALVAIAIFSYQKSVRRTQSAEAIHAMQAIRTSQQAYHAQHQRYTEADSTKAINELLGLDLEESLFSYEIIDASDADFVVIARRIGTNLADFFGQMMLTMNSSGAIAYIESPLAVPPASSAIDVLAGGGSSSGGGSGGTGSGGGGGSSNSSGGGGGGGTRGSAVTVTSLTSVTLIVPFSYSGSCNNAVNPTSLEYIEPCSTLFTTWADTDNINITGTGAAVLGAAFDFIANNPPFSATTDDIFNKGISVSFDPNFASKCGDAIACLYTDPSGTVIIPSGPTIPPVILFNPDYIGESAEMLSNVLVHEGTHFQQFLDGDIFSSSLDVVDTEFRAFWNGAAHWATIRDSFGPPFSDSPLESSNESWYQSALAGEATLRSAIAAVYL